MLRSASTPKEICRFWKKHSPIVAKIVEVSDTGIISIEFDKPLIPIDRHLLDQTALNITIIPNENASNMTVFGFHFICKSFESQLVQIQMLFD